ncbi:MAG: efflux RND transporter periplasmic adaptor subunit [Rhodospirillales bacterium]|nr:efflux RND transporter periplasmic adaptor subunit [Rhodospirillales bacterium]
MQAYTSSIMDLRGLTLCAALTALAAALPTDARGQDAVAVVVDAVSRDAIVETATVIGRFVSRQSGVVAAQSEGAVGEVFVEIGDRVAAGETLVQLETDRLTLSRDLRLAEVASAEAQVGVARAELALARQELERLESLTESAAFSQARYEDSLQNVAIGEAGVAQARADLFSAEANLALMEDELADATIVAPYDAVVIRRHTEVGAYIDVGEAAVTLLNDGWIEIEADVPSNRIDGLVPGTVIRIVLDNGSHAEAFVRAVGVSEDPQARTRLVRFTPAWDVIEGTLAEGQSVSLHVPAGPQADVITVHKDAVIRSARLTTVFVARQDAETQEWKVVDRTVALGAGLGNRFVVLDGLDAGDLAVVRGNEYLWDGAVVEVSQ